MNRVENIERYLRATLAAERRTVPASGHPEPVPFVTISRQAGIGGHDLAEAMLTEFSQQPETDLFHGWQIYDKTICEIVAKDPQFSRSLDSLLEEEYRSRTTDFFHQMLRATADQTLVTERVFLVVRAIASMGRSIIVGRGSSHATNDLPMGVHLRVVAPEDERVRRTMDLRGLSERDARAFVKARDADRARLLKVHFGVDIDDPLGYDLTCNAASATFDEVAAAVAGIVRTRASVPAESGKR
jgi:cytidylate kinase